MPNDYAEVDCVYCGHAPSGYAIFIAIDPDDYEDAIAIPIGALSEDSRNEVENADRYDDLTLEIEESLANERGLI